MGCGPGQTAQVYIAGAEQTSVSIAGGWTPRLNRPAQATVTIPMEIDAGDCGELLMITLDDDEIVFHGPILNTEVETDKDGGTVKYNAQDHMELWQWRPVRDADGDFSKPGIIVDFDTAPQIMEAALEHTISAGGGPPTDAEGEIFLDIGTVEGGGASVAGAPTDWPMTIMDLFALLVSTGQLDGVIEYQDTGTTGNTGTVSFYNGDYGTDLSASVDFDYGQGARTARAIKWNRDMTNLVNKYWIFGGPRIETAADPKGEQHWCFNVTGDDPGVQALAGWSAVSTRRSASQAAVGVRMKIDIFDGYDEDCIPGFGTPGRQLYRWQWLIYSYYASIAKEIVHVLPTDDTYVGCFGIGDLVGVSASSEVKGGFSGAQRVYEYTVSWEATPSLLTLSEIQTSSDAEGMT